MMGEVRRIKVNKSVTKNKLLDYGFRYKENGDYRLYVPVYKWNDKTTIYAYFYINIEENIFTYDIQSEGSTYYPYYNETNSEVNRGITENINTEIIKLIKKGILKTYENNKQMRMQRFLHMVANLQQVQIYMR